MPHANLLFLAATHGDEGFSVPILQGLKTKFPASFDWLIANERAQAHNTRFTDIDLNRSAPGDPISPLYEVRRAHEILEITKNYRYVIDIHGTTANSGIFVIIPNPTPINIALASCLPIIDVVIWAAKSSAQQGPITQFVNCGVEIECGPKHDPAVAERLETILPAILTKGIVPDLAPMQRWYRVYGYLQSGPANLRDFQLATVDGETFFPLLVSQYRTELCYKMERLDLNALLAY